MQAIPIGLLKKDLIALAPTGEGKTLAYLIPLISYLERLPLQTPLTCENGPYSLIIVPSR
jgi:ATP-dependent RNA helicase DDX23/PRP28